MNARPEGALRCTSTCSFDPSGCTAPTPPPGSGGTFGGGGTGSGGLIGSGGTF
jgi:hypothetical protein